MPPLIPTSPPDKIVHVSLNLDHAYRSAELILSVRATISRGYEQKDYVDALDGLIVSLKAHIDATPPDSSEYAIWRSITVAMGALGSQIRYNRIAEGAEGSILEAKARRDALCEDLRNRLVTGSWPVIRDESLKSRVFCDQTRGGIDVRGMQALLKSTPIPLTYFKYSERENPYHRHRSPAKKAEPEPIIKLITNIDKAPCVAPQLVQPEILYSLRFRINGIYWPPDAKTLQLQLVTTCPADQYSLPEVFSCARPDVNENQEYAADLNGHILFKYGQSMLSDPLYFTASCAFELPNGNFKTVHVIGHNRLSFRVVAPGRWTVSGYKRLDEHLADLVGQLLKSNPEIEGELPELMPLLNGLTGLLGAYSQGAVFKTSTDLSESEFQKEVLKDLRLNPELGQHVEEHPKQAGGFTDIRYKGVVVELKVEKDDADRRRLSEKYAGQPVQYQGVEARQIAVLLVLDLTPKTNPPGDIRNDIFLVDVPTHGGVDADKKYASKLFVFVVNGNIHNPSDYSRQS